MYPDNTIVGIEIKPINPSRHSKAKANNIPRIIVEKFIRIVETRVVTKLFNSLESTPKRLAACPPRFYFRSYHLTGSLNNLWFAYFLIFSVIFYPTMVSKVDCNINGKKMKHANPNNPKAYISA